MRTNSLRVFVELLRILRPFWPLVAAASLMGAVTGLASAALVATVNRALHHGDSAAVQLLASFAVLCLLSIAGEILGSIASSRLTQHVVAFLRYELTDRILDAPIAEIERHKPHRLLAILDIDVPTIGAFAMQFSGLAVAIAVTAGCFGYMVALSPPLFAVTLLAAAIGVAVQVAVTRAGTARFDAVREAHDELQKHYRALIEGAKELRISRPRRTRTTERLHAAIETVRVRITNTVQLFLVGKAASSAIFFATLLVVFVASMALAVDNVVLSGFVLALLYVKGPTEQLIGGLPLLGAAQASLRKVSELSAGFAPVASALPRPAAAVPPFVGDTIALVDAVYQYPASEMDGGFTLGPVELEIRRGETLFIVGANGTGKTTLIKLLTGLYTPAAGTLLCDGRPVDRASLDAYRELFSVIFFDFFLFDDLVSARPFWREEAARYLDMLEIAHKVSIRGEVFTTTDLSTGQRKRLALVQALLEDRPIIVLDEWAADQDPAFRHAFYAQLLPELKRQGKTLVVVSHDDRYFGIADRIVTMAAGRFVDTTRAA